MEPGTFLLYLLVVTCVWHHVLMFDCDNYLRKMLFTDVRDAVSDAELDVSALELRPGETRSHPPLQPSPSAVTYLDDTCQSYSSLPSPWQPPGHICWDFSVQQCYRLEIVILKYCRSAVLHLGGAGHCFVIISNYGYDDYDTDNENTRLVE